MKTETKYQLAALYLLGGALTLAKSVERAGAGKPVWPGLLDANQKPPGASAGAYETIALWFIPASKYITGSLNTQAAQQGTARALQRSTPTAVRVIGPLWKAA